MLPVSGAEQLNASDAHTLAPMHPARCAYSRFVSPGPVKERALGSLGDVELEKLARTAGSHRFHKPARLANVLSRSTSAHTDQRSGDAACALERRLGGVDVLGHEPTQRDQKRRPRTRFEPNRGRRLEGRRSRRRPRRPDPRGTPPGTVPATRALDSPTSPQCSRRRRVGRGRVPRRRARAHPRQDGRSSKQR